MPLAHSLSKVKKNLSKSTGSMHIKGRKFKQLNRATLREHKLTNKKMRSKEQKDNDLAAVHFFQGEVEKEEKEKFSDDDIKAIMERFLGRHDEEIEQLRSDRRPGRPPSARQSSLEQLVKHERHVYRTGYKVPDIRDKDTVMYLRKWNGSTGGITAMKLFLVFENSNENKEDADMS